MFLEVVDTLGTDNSVGCLSLVEALLRHLLRDTSKAGITSVQEILNTLYRQVAGVGDEMGIPNASIIIVNPLRIGSFSLS